MKKLFFITILIPLFSFAQRNFINPQSTFRGASNFIVYSNIDGIVGHKYFADEWLQGNIIINDTIFFSQSKINYNMISNELIIADSNDERKGIIILDTSVTGFIIKKEREKYFFVKKNKNEFNEEVESNFFYSPIFGLKKDYLIVDHKKYLSEPGNNKSSYSTTDKDKTYKEKKTYYMLGSDNFYTKTKLNKKSLLKKLSNKKPELIKYIKTQRLNLKKENDVAKLIWFYHTL